MGFGQVMATTQKIEAVSNNWRSAVRGKGGGAGRLGRRRRQQTVLVCKGVFPTGVALVDRAQVTNGAHQTQLMWVQDIARLIEQALPIGRFDGEAAVDVGGIQVRRKGGDGVPAEPHYRGLRVC